MQSSSRVRVGTRKVPRLYCDYFWPLPFTVIYACSLPLPPPPPFVLSTAWHVAGPPSIFPCDTITLSWRKPYSAPVQNSVLCGPVSLHVMVVCLSSVCFARWFPRELPEGGDLNVSCESPVCQLCALHVRPSINVGKQAEILAPEPSCLGLCVI